MWAAMSAIQIMSYLTLLNLHFPQNLLAFLEYIESVHNFSKWFPNPFAFILKESQLDMSPLNEQFESRGFPNRNMLLICGSDLIMLALMLLAILVLSPLAGSCT